MNQGFSLFLSNSLRMLNIANRVIPLVKDISPQIMKVRNTIYNLSTNAKNINNSFIQNINKKDVSNINPPTNNYSNSFKGPNFFK